MMNRKSAVFCRGRHVRHERANANTNQIERARENERPARQIAHVHHVRRRKRIDAQHAECVFGERDRDGAERGGADDDELRPREQGTRRRRHTLRGRKRRSAGLRRCARQFRRASARAAHGEGPPATRTIMGSGPGSLSAMPAGRTEDSESIVDPTIVIALQTNLALQSSSDGGGRGLRSSAIVTADTNWETDELRRGVRMPSVSLGS